MEFKQSTYSQHMTVMVIIPCVVGVLSLASGSVWGAVSEMPQRHSVEPRAEQDNSVVGEGVGIETPNFHRGLETGWGSRYVAPRSFTGLAEKGSHEVHLRFSHAGSLFGVELGLETHSLRSLHWWVPSPQLQDTWRSDSPFLTLSGPSTMQDHSGAFLRFTW